VPSIPDRHPARGRARIDAGIVDMVKFPGEADMRLGPQRLNHPHLLRRANAAVVEVLVKADELDLVPTEPIPSRNRPPDNWSSEAACFATKTACRCPRIKTPTAKPMCWVQPDKKPNSTNGS